MDAEGLEEELAGVRAEVLVARDSEDRVVGTAELELGGDRGLFRHQGVLELAIAETAIEVAIVALDK